MNQNDFITNTNPKEEKHFSIHFRFLLNCVIWLTAIITITGVGYVIYHLFLETPQNETEWRLFIFNVLFFISMFCCNICCQEIKITQKLFSKRLVFFIHFIGILQIIVSIIHPSLGANSGFTLLIFFDGNTFTIGLLIFLFGSLLKEAYFMQNEIDEIL